MPTGYTAKLADGEQSVGDFLRDLSRGMGFMIMMRDEPSSAGIPERFEPSAYHKDELAKALKRLEALNALSEKEIAEQTKAEYAKELELLEQRGTKNKSRAARYQKMIDRIRAWQPEGEAMIGTKRFALEQLEQSLKFDCTSWDAPEVITPNKWWSSQVERAAKDIIRHTEEYAAEVERTEGRNEALAQLRQAITELEATDA